MISLNETQKAAVTAADGPALVLAGAGSGKTRIIVERMAWLVEERGIDPRHLLALTFTNKAAYEMRSRFATRLNVERVATWLGTFHAFGLYLLRRDMERLDRPKTFSIFDDSDQLSLMKRLVRDLPRPFEKVAPRRALNWISRLKQLAEEPDFSEEDLDQEELAYRELWHRYHNALIKAAAVDFDDLLVLPVKLLEKNDDLRAKYQHRFRYVLIDEYQDTNRAQYLFTRYLSEAHGNIFVVGDEDQSIYSWRGADINNILDFANDFPGAQVYRLEQNYRSTQPILDVANALVAHNINRLGKNLWTDLDKGDRVRLFRADTGEEEAQFVVEDMMKRAISPRDVAVLYRTNTQSRLIEDALRHKGLNYVLIGGIKFYGRKEIKDLMAYLRLLVNSADDESLRRIINVPTRGIGRSTLEHLEEYAKRRDIPIFDVLREVETDDTLPSRARKNGLEFVQIIDDLALDARQGKVAPVVKNLIERTKYRDYVEHSDEKDFRSRIDIVDEFVSSCAEHDKSGKGGLLEFLQDLALLSEVDEWDPESPAVTLMSCHAAKGLEFDHIYLIGMEEELMPFGTGFREPCDIEEERRLCYVAMTRARKSLTISAAKSRMIYGETKRNRKMSRFIFEAGIDRFEAIGPKTPARHKAQPEKATAPAAKIRMGTRVRHARFGPGTVMFTQGANAKMKVRVRFDTGRTALLLLSVAPLEILEGKKT
jgi:DNA helicase II / ATP-dependent DNA helicase PcrA